jgi:hypothetical protein
VFGITQGRRLTKGWPLGDSRNAFCGTFLWNTYRYQLIYRPIFQFEAAFVRWHAESSYSFFVRHSLIRRVKASHPIELGRTVCG